jgi:diacylglycerol kinase family enzyme
MIVILNPAAGAGTAQEKWREIEPQVRRRVGPFTLVLARDVDTVDARIAAALRAGERRFVAAGGDGTVNLVAAAIIRHAPRLELQTVKLGAVGLGSSNDFHKPLAPERQIAGVPVRLDFASTIWHDIGLLTYRDAADALRSRRWLINASIGTTAEANLFFNNPSRPLRLLKRFLPSWGIMYAALRTLFRFRGREMKVTLDETETVHGRVNNLGVVKNPHFTGRLRYDSPYEPGSGHVYVHLLRNLSLPRLLLALIGLARGRFSGRNRACSWRATRVRIEADRPFAIEGDGEVTMARRAYFSVVPDLLQLCT